MSVESASENVPLPSNESDFPNVVVDPLEEKRRKRLDNYLHRKHARRALRKAYKERKKARRHLEEQQHQPVVSMQDTGLSDCPMQPTKLSRKALCHYLSMSESPCSTKIVLDCGYDHLMSFKGVCKLANQISSCYAFNRRSTIPVQLYVTGLNPSGSIRSTNDSSVHLIDRLLLVGSDHWDIHLVDDDFYNVFDQKSIVYLCAESPHILPDRFPSSTPDPSLGVDLPISLNDIFVIGGLVDHNHRPGYCYEQATRRGYRTARLPISESGIRMNCRRVLSTFEVFKALAPVIAGTSTWSDSLEAAIPSRKKLN